MNKYKKKIVILSLLIGLIVISLIGLFLINDNKINYSINEYTSQTNDYDNPELNKSLEEWININDDVIGILKINGKEFPVVQSDDNDEYLHKSIYGDYDIFGVPYVDYQIDTNDYDNLIIYGHSTYDKDLVFTFVEKYIENDQEDLELEFSFEDSKGNHKYKIVAARQVSSDENADRSWYAYKFTDENAKIAYIKDFMREADAVYDNNIKGKFMLLVTCNMEEQENRYLLLACEK